MAMATDQFWCGVASGGITEYHCIASKGISQALALRQLPGMSSLLISTFPVDSPYLFCLKPLPKFFSVSCG